MDHILQRNEYYSQSEFQSSMNNMSIDNRSMPHVVNSSILSSNIASSSSPNVNRTRPMSQLDGQWKTSSPSLSSSDKSGWKTSSTQTKKTVETWKMSAKPRHAQLPHIDDPNFRRHSAMPDMMSRPKPLPQEPMMPISEPFNLNLPQNDNNTPAPFHLNTPSQPPAFIQPNHFSTPIQSHMPQPPLPQPPMNNYSSPYLPSDMMYTTSNVDYPPPIIHNQPYSQPPSQMMDYQHTMDYQPQQQQPIYNSPPVMNDPAIYTPPAPVPSSSAQTSQQQHSPPKTNNTKPTKDEKKNKKPEKRQITVQSINPEHRVWIDVLPNETGKSLAEKIHIIATFRTRKIVSITSASGRKIPIDNRPVFGNWTDMEKFEDGERWAVEWRANDKSVVDKFFSKMVQGK